MHGSTRPLCALLITLLLLGSRAPAPAGPSPFEPLAAGDGQAQASSMPKAEQAKLRALLAAALVGEKGALEKLTKAGKAWQGKHEWSSLLATLRQGPALEKGEPRPRGKGKQAERLERFGSVTTGFTFTVDDERYRYAVDVPPGYDPEQPAEVLLDPGHGVAAQASAEEKAGYLGYYRNQADAAGLERALVVRSEVIEEIGAGGKRGAKPDEQVVRVFDALLRDLATRFALDLDRIWVSGLSQTGYWAWQLGATHADRFAGIAPMGAVTWQVKDTLDNCSNLSIWILHGDEDATCPVAQPRATAKLLVERGYRHFYKEVAGGKHDFSTWQHLSEGLAWLSERPRERYPALVQRKLQTLAQPWCAWIRIDELSRTGSGEGGKPPTASLRAEIRGQEVRLESEGVKRLTLCLASELLSLDAPIEVVWNGSKKADRKLERDFATTLELAVERADWSALYECALELRE